MLLPPLLPQCTSNTFPQLTSGESKLSSERSKPEAARRSPRVSAPRLCSRRATAAAKRRSPPGRGYRAG